MGPASSQPISVTTRSSIRSFAAWSPFDRVREHRSGPLGFDSHLTGIRLVEGGSFPISSAAPTEFADPCHQRIFNNSRTRELRTSDRAG